MKNITLFLSFLLSSSCCLLSQVGIGTLNPSSRTVLELKTFPGKGKGLLIPRVSTDERRGMELGNDSIGTPLSNNENGLFLFDNSQNLFFGYDPYVPTVSGPYPFTGLTTPAEDQQRKWQVLNPWRSQYAWDGSQLLLNLIQDTTASGYVGIGWIDHSVAPLEQLHVKGNGLFEGELRVGIDSVSKYTLHTFQVEGSGRVGGALDVDGDLEVIGNTDITKKATAETVIADTVGQELRTNFYGFGIVPIGVICMWSGSPTVLPEGWKLCDGSPISATQSPIKGNYTPNLSGKFVVGFDPLSSVTTPDTAKNKELNYGAVGNMGGENAHQLTIDEMPSHSHKIVANHQFGTREATDHRKGGNWQPAPPSSITSTSTGGNVTHENRPPYYVIAYIMRIY